MADEPLTRRALGRALLARQHLLERLPVGDDGPSAVRGLTDHLVGLQAQNPQSPYLALWSRLEGFVPDHLSTTLLERRTARVAAMRSTVHLLTAADALVLPRLTARRLPAQTRRLPAGELQALAARARTLLEATPLRAQQLGALLAPDWPDVEPGDLAYAARCLLSLVQVTPRGVWGASMATTWTTAEAWLPRHLVAAAPDVEDPEVRTQVLGRVVLRYLAAFGPATVQDVQAWCGLTGLAPVVAALGDDVLRLAAAPAADRPRRQLLDLPDAPRPDPDTPAPVRLLPDFDNVLLSHADRTRIVSDEVRRRMVTPNGAGPGTLLVNGQVAGVWRLRRHRGGDRAELQAATVGVELFGALPRAQRREVELEAERLVRFVAPEATDHRVQVTAAV